MVRAADRRADLVPSEYEAKAKGQMRHLAPREARRSSKRSGLSPRCEESPWEHSANLASPSMCLSKASPTKALLRTSKIRPEQLQGSLRTNPLVAKAPMGSPGSHHGHRDALRRPRVRRRLCPAAGCCVPCPCPGPGRLARR
jgi:hypothetical protein